MRRAAPAGRRRRRPATCIWPPGQLTPAELMADIKEGLYVTEMIGMGVNGVTGDYSRGAAGFMIRDGALAEPVAEVTVAGNLLEMFGPWWLRRIWCFGAAPTRRRFGSME